MTTTASPWAGLERYSQHHLQMAQEEALGPNGSKTAQIRRLLQVRGPMTAAQLLLADEIDWPASTDSGRVGALLKWDIAQGRIVRDGNTYRLADDYDPSIDPKIGAAIILLRRAGYTVEEP